MPTLTIGNQSVQVGDNFLSLPPEQQNATVDEIAKSLGVTGSQQTATAPQEESPSIGDVAESLGTGAVKGILGMVGGIPDLANLAAKGIDYETGSNLEKYTQPASDYAGNAALQGYAQKLGIPFHTPQSTLGRYAESVGSFLPMAIGPETAVGKLASVVAPGIASEAAGQYTEGTPLETPARVAGAVLGGAAPGALGRAVSPVASKTADAVATLEKEGMDTSALTAGMATGSKATKAAESEFGNAAGAGGLQTAANDRALEAYTQAAANKVPEFQGMANLTSDNLDTGRQAISNKFDQAIAATPAVNLDNKFVTDVDNVKSNFTGLTGIQPTLIDKFMTRLTQTNPASPVINGAIYQQIRSEVGNLARKAPDFAAQDMLYGFQHALDGAVQRSISNPVVQAQWQQARKSWGDYLVLKRAVDSSSENAAKGFLTPATLTNAVKKYQADGYTLGNNTFANLARAGNVVMKDFPESGTSQRIATHIIPSVIGAVLGHGLGALPGAAMGIAAPAVAGRVLHSRLGQAYLKNQKAAGLRGTPAQPLRAGILGTANQNQ